MFTSLILAASFFHTLHATDWHSEYVRALRSKPAEACQIFRQLSNRNTARLSDLALVRRESSCQANSIDQLKSLIQSPEKQWLHPLALRAAFDIASRNNLYADLLWLAPQLVELEKSQNKLDQILSTALEAARSLGQTQDEERLLGLLYKNSPRLIPNPTPEQYLVVAKDCQRNREFQRAADFYEKIFLSSPHWKERLEARDGVRRAIKEKFRTGQGPKSEFFEASTSYGQFAFETLTQLENQGELNLDDHRQLTNAFFQHGRDFWGYADTNEEQERRVREVVERYLASSFTRPEVVAEAYVLLSRVSQNYQKWSLGAQEAARALEFFSQKGQPQELAKWQKDLMDKALWFDAFLTRKVGNFELSLKKMEDVAIRSHAVWASRRARFWMGRTAMQLERPDEARFHYEELIEDYPYHYYSLWARYDAQIPLTPAPSVIDLTPQRPASVSEDNHQFILSLVRASETELARVYLNKFLNPSSKDINHLIYRDFVGDHKTVLSAFFYSMNGEEKRDFQDNYFSLLYPRPHWELVEQQAARWDHVDSFYVYSIMRQESGFDPFSHSWADARGLLQLVPRVAIEEQERAGVTYNHVDELFIPEVNIPLGVAALDTRFQINYNSYIVSTAAYNAGEHRVHRWLRNIYGGDVFEFMEDIPTEETRVYIRLVARNYLANMRLSATEDFLIPDWLFTIPDID